MTCFRTRRSYEAITARSRIGGLVTWAGSLHGGRIDDCEIHAEQHQARGVRDFRAALFHVAGPHSCIPDQFAEGAEPFQPRHLSVRESYPINVDIPAVSEPVKWLRSGNDPDRVLYVDGGSLRGDGRVSFIGTKPRRHFTEAARAAALAARRAKMKAPEDFGIPRLFVVRKDPRTFTWELRRFGGVIVERGTAPFDTFAAAKAAGSVALAGLCASPDLPTFKRQNVD